MVCSFTVLKKRSYIFVALCILTCSSLTYAQAQIEGIIYDAQTNQRVSKTYIYNTANDDGTYNNLKGEFRLTAKPGDVLIAAAEGYYPDTLVVPQAKTVYFRLERSSIWLKEVSIMGRRNPAQDLEQKKQDYRTAYRKGTPGSLLSIGPTGAGLSIDALYALISREGRNARFLQEIIERDYRNAVIDYRYTRTLVKNVTGIDDRYLEDFMVQYRPSYYFILSASEYSLAYYIKQSFQQYRRNPAAYRLPRLPQDTTFKKDPDG